MSGEEALPSEPPIVPNPLTPATLPEGGPTSEPAGAADVAALPTPPSAAARAGSSLPAPSAWRPLGEESDEGAKGPAMMAATPAAAGYGVGADGRGRGGRGGCCALLCARVEPWAGLALLLGVVMMGTSVIVLATRLGGGSSNCVCECPATTTTSSSSSSFESAAADSEEARALVSLWNIFTSDGRRTGDDPALSVSALDEVLASDFEEHCDWDPHMCPLNRSTVLLFHNLSAANFSSGANDTASGGADGENYDGYYDAEDDPFDVTYSETIAVNASEGMLCSIFQFTLGDWEYLGCDAMRADVDSGVITGVSNFFNTPRLTIETINTFTELQDACLREKAIQGDPSLPYPCRLPGLREGLEAVLSPKWVGHLYNGTNVNREAFIQQLLFGSLHDAGELWLDAGETFTRLDDLYLEQSDLAAHAFQIQVNSTTDCVGDDCVRYHTGMTLHRLGQPFAARPWPPSASDQRIRESQFFSSHRSA